MFILATFSRIFAFCFHTGPNHRVIYAVIFNSLLKWVAFCPSAPEQSKYTSGMPAAVSQYVCVCVYTWVHICSKPSQHTSIAWNVCLSRPYFLFSFFFLYASDVTAVDLGQLGIPQCISTRRQQRWQEVCTPEVSKSARKGATALSVLGSTHIEKQLICVSLY